MSHEFKIPEVDGLRVELAETGVVTVTLNRPERKNALTFDIYRAMTDVFADMERDARVRTEDLARL